MRINDEQEFIAWCIANGHARAIDEEEEEPYCSWRDVVPDAPICYSESFDYDGTDPSAVSVYALRSDVFVAVHQYGLDVWDHIEHHFGCAILVKPVSETVTRWVEIEDA